MSIVADRPATKIPSGTWSIDPIWSALEFEVKKIGLINVKGRVLGFTGTIRGSEHPSIEGTVDVSSITTFDETRDGHVQSPDFFDVARYPELGAARGLGFDYTRDAPDNVSGLELRLAHLLGFAVGVTEGLAVRGIAPPRRSLRQPAIALLAVAPIALAWWRALAQ